MNTRAYQCMFQYVERVQNWTHTSKNEIARAQSFVHKYRILYMLVFSEMATLAAQSSLITGTEVSFFEILCIMHHSRRQIRFC